MPIIFKFIENISPNSHSGHTRSCISISSQMETILVLRTALRTTEIITNLIIFYGAAKYAVSLFSACSFQDILLLDKLYIGMPETMHCRIPHTAQLIEFG